MKNKPKVIAIVGPNASGKSDLAVKLAQKINGEIISADSRQIYKGLNIGTGKVPGRWRRQIPSPISTPKPANSTRPLSICGFFYYRGIIHHCLDLTPPRQTYNAAKYKQRAQKAIKEITERGKIPIIVGGTGFWIDALVYNLELPAVPPNPKLRKKLEKKSAVELLAILKKIDPARASTIEQKNPRRLIRAIEIVQTLGPVLKIKKHSPYQVLWLGVKWPKEILRKRIHERLLKRLRTGMIKEARNLKKQGVPWRRFYELGLEYRFLADYLRGRLNKKEMLEKIERADQQYARRQIVWFKRNKKIHWVQKPKEAQSLVKKFLA